MDSSHFVQVTGRLRKTLAETGGARQEVLDLVIAGLFAGGHVLLIDVPGVGKTLLAKTLALSLGARFQRIQCTSDLLPADITGGAIFNQKVGAFEFSPGPIFAHVVLADEINRATPRTQSALLEAMGERQVTADGTTYPLPQPFFLIATQNPVEAHGTFPLPEAELDRFILSASLGYPPHDQALRVLQLDERAPTDVTAVLPIEEVLACQRWVRAVAVMEQVRDYIVSLAEATRGDPRVALGPSPRATVDLQRMGQAWAGLTGRDFATPDDVKAVAVAVLGHRLMLEFQSETSSAAIIGEILQQVPVPL